MRLLYGFVISAVLYSLAVTAIDRGRFDAPVAIGPVALQGFETCGPGCFRAVENKSEFHQLATHVQLTPRTYYRVAYSVGALPSPAQSVTVDFIAPSYDDPAQEKRVLLGFESLYDRVDAVWNSGNAPAHATARLFYTGSPGLTVRNFRVSAVQGGAMAFAWFCAASTLALAMAMLIVAWRTGRFKETLRAIAAKREFGEYGWLVAVYFLVVLVRTAQFNLTPYWSGDEYVYRMLAALQWWLGTVSPSSGQMIGHSAAFPNLLYPVFIAPAFAFDLQFHMVIRILNALALCSVIFPLYALARLFADRWLSVLFALFSTAIPFVNVGAYAVAEVLFYPLFCWAAYLMVRTTWAAIGTGVLRQRDLVLSGIATGLLASVKLNGFVALGAAGYAFAFLWLLRPALRSRVLIGFGTLCVATGLSFTVAYFISHGGELPSFGVYGNFFNVLASGRSMGVLSNLKGVVDLVLGHVATIAVPFAFTVVACLWRSIQLACRHDALTKNDALHLIAAGSFLVYFGLSIVFVMIVASDDLGGLGRWHSRYYFFVLPLVALSGLILFRDGGIIASSRSRVTLMIAVLVTAVGAMAFVYLRPASLSPWFGSIDDNMDAAWIVRYRAFVPIGALLVVISAIMLIFRLRNAGASVVALTVSWLLVANAGTLGAAHLGTQDTGSRCGAFVGSLIAMAPGKFAVLGDNRRHAVEATFLNPYLPSMVVWGIKAGQFAEFPAVADVQYVVTNGAVEAMPEWRKFAVVGNCIVYHPR